MSLELDSAAQDLLFREARTANTFTDEPVTEEQVQAIYDLVKYGPTAFNQTPLRVILVRSAEARERLVQAHGRGQPAEDRRRPAGRDPRRGQRVPRGAPAAAPALPAGQGPLLRRAPGPRGVRAAQRRPAGRVLHRRRPRRRPGRGPDDRLRLRRRPEGVPGRRPHPADGRQHRQARARTPGSRAPRAWPTTRSSPPSELGSAGDTAYTTEGPPAARRGPSSSCVTVTAPSSRLLFSACAISVSRSKDAVPVTTVVAPLSWRTRASYFSPS